MFSCKFTAAKEALEEIDALAELDGLSNISVFENSELGFSECLDDNGFPLAKFFDVEILTNDLEAANLLRDRFSSKIGVSLYGDISVKEVADTDWVELYERELTPVICDGFYFYNGNIQNHPFGDWLVHIKLNSAMAFGSGHHQSTKCCIRNISYMRDTGENPVNILDMGCGTGILGICAMKTWVDSNIISVDIDPEAVRITKENCLLNDVNANVIVSDVVPVNGPKMDLIICNILKQPLLDFCDDFYDILNEHGIVITSGFITRQEEEIMTHYTSKGFLSLNRVCLEDWVSIMFVKK